MIGAHGAGLANAVVCSRGTTIFEILPATGVDALPTCYVRLAHALALRYIGMVPHVAPYHNGEIRLHVAETNLLVAAVRESLSYA